MRDSIANIFSLKTPSLNNLLQNTTLLDSGADSHVYKYNSEDSVIKVYKNLRTQRIKSMNKGICLELVRAYNADTLLAKETIDSNWKDIPEEQRTIVLSNKPYKINIEILPQGEPMLAEEVVAIGQKYVPEPNLKTVLEHYTKIPGFEDFYDAPNDNTTTIRRTLAEAAKIIETKTNMLFQIENTNVKPILDETKMELNLIITDLAARISRTYWTDY